MNESVSQRCQRRVVMCVCVCLLYCWFSLCTSLTHSYTGHFSHNHTHRHTLAHSLFLLLLQQLGSEEKQQQQPPRSVWLFAETDNCNIETVNRGERSQPKSVECSGVGLPEEGERERERTE